MVLLRLFQPAHGFLGIFDEVEKAGGVAGVIAGELVGAQGERSQRAEPTRNMPLTFLGDASYSRRNILYTASIR